MEEKHGRLELGVGIDKALVQARLVKRTQKKKEDTSLRI